MIPDCSSEVNFSKMSIKPSGQGWSTGSTEPMTRATIIQHLTNTGKKGRNRSPSFRWQISSIRQTAPTLSVRDLIQKKKIAPVPISTPQPQNPKADILCPTMVDQTKISILERSTTSQHLKRTTINSTHTLKTIKIKLSTLRTGSEGNSKKAIPFG